MQGQVPLLRSLVYYRFFPSTAFAPRRGSVEVHHHFRAAAPFVRLSRRVV